METEQDLKFEFFKKSNYHFLPMYGPDITIEQATQMSKSGGSCGGPYWPVRQSTTEKSLKFEIESRKVASRLRADFNITNQLPPHSPWWKKNKIYLKWLEFQVNRKKSRYGIKQRPALVVSLNGKHRTFYSWDNLEKEINKFRIKAM